MLSRSGSLNWNIEESGAMRNWLFELFRIQQHLVDLEHNGFSLEHVSSRSVVDNGASRLVHLQPEDELRALDLV